MKIEIPFFTNDEKDDGKNIMFSNTLKTEVDKKKQEKIWEEVINLMQKSINNMGRG